MSMLIKMAEHFKKPEMWNFKIYRGVVVDNADPAKIKRARVTIDGIYPEGSNDNLPWVGAFTDSPKSLNAPEIGDELAVIFPFDDVYHPFYLGYWNSGTTGQEYLQDDYPNTMGFIYENLKARFNKKTKIGEIVHSSGTSISIDADGNLTLNTEKDYTQTPQGKYSLTSGSDMSFNSGGKLDLQSSGDMSVTSGGKFTLNASGDLVIKSTAKATFSGTGGTTVGDASSQTQVLGATVALGQPGGSPVALVGISLVQGVGNLGIPVISQILTGSSTVTASP